MSTIFKSTKFLASRRNVIRAGLSGAAMLALGAISPTFATDLVTVRVGAPVGSVNGVKTAIDAGYFEQEGLKVEFVTLSGGPAILAATVGGSVDVGYSDIFAWVGSLDNGFDLKLVGNANGRGNVDYIVAGPKSGIRTPADLRGKKIGTAAHAQSKLRVTLYLERFGLSADDVQLVTINQRDTVGAALSAGQIDAAIASDPNVAQWERQFGIVPLEGRPWEQIPEKTSTAGFFATQKFIDEHPGVIEKFVRAARKGATRYLGFTAEQKAQIDLKFDGTDLFALEKETPGVLQRLNADNATQDGPVDLDALKTWLQIARDHGVIKKVIDLTPHIYPTALAANI